jgi:hypothetical protein
MHKILGILLVVAAVTFSQTDNYGGYLDTSKVAGFYSTNSCTSKVFRLTSYENLRVSVFVMDTAVTGAANYQTAFIWGIQWGHMSWTSGRKTVWVWQPRCLVDTFRVSAAYCAERQYVRDSLGNVDGIKMYTDTTSANPWALQDRPITPEWDQEFRFWATGISGNKSTANLPVVFHVTRRLGVGTVVK